MVLTDLSGFTRLSERLARKAARARRTSSTPSTPVSRPCSRSRGPAGGRRRRGIRLGVRRSGRRRTQACHSSCDACSTRRSPRSRAGPSARSRCRPAVLSLQYLLARDYATIDVLAALGMATPGDVRERDEILARLRIDSDPLTPLILHQACRGQASGRRRLASRMWCALRPRPSRSRPSDSYGLRPDTSSTRARR